MSLQGHLRQAFLVGLENVLDSYIGGYLCFSDAIGEIETVTKDGDDYYENVPLFGPLTVKEKICALANLAQDLLVYTEPSERICEMWAQATAYVVFQGLIAEAEVEHDMASENKEEEKWPETGRLAVLNLYNELIADEECPEININDFGEWRKAGEELWDYLVECSREPWADEDFMIGSCSHDYPPKTDEADFRRSLSILMDVCKVKV